MTDLTPQITGTDLTSTRATQWAGNQYLSLSPNPNCYTARVNGAMSGGTSVAQITYDGGAGTLADVEPGMTVLISETNDKAAAYLRLRVRKDPTATILYVNETSAAIDDNDYIFILWDWDIWQKLPRDDGTTRYNDFDSTFSATNNGMPPIIEGLYMAYAGKVSGSPAKLQIRFQPTATAATSGAAISSYLFDIVYGSASVDAGAEASADVTYGFSEGFNIVKFVVTDDGGRTTTRFIPVFAHGDTFKYEQGFSGASIVGDSGKWTATVDAFDGVSSVLDRTLAVIWTEEYYGSTEKNIVSNVNFAGRLRTENTRVQTAPVWSQRAATTFEIEGPADSLASTAAQLATLIDDSSPSAWDEIDDLTLWRAAWYVLNQFSTAPFVCCFKFDHTGTDYQIALITVDPQDIFSSVDDVMFSRMSKLEFSAQGIGYINPDARYLTAAERAALTTVINFSDTDRTTVDVNREYREAVGQVSGYAAWYDSASGNTEVIGSYAPGVAQGEGIERSEYSKQILKSDQIKADAQSQWAQRTADHFERVQPKDRLSVAAPTGAYHYFNPTVSSWYTWTLSASDSGRPAYTTSTRWLLERIEHSHDNATGARSVSMAFIAETQGAAAATFDPPQPSEFSFTQLDFPPFDAFPALSVPSVWLPAAPGAGDFPPFPGDPTSYSSLPPRDGNTIVAGMRDEGTNTDSGLFVTTNGLNPVPSWREITPEDDTEIRDFEYKDRVGAAYPLEGYCLTYDGTDSTFWHTENFLEDDWSEQYTWSGERYDFIRVMPETGIYVVSTFSAGGATTYTDNMTAALGSDTHTPSASWPFGLWPCPGGTFYKNGAPRGTYSASGGRTGGGSVVGQDIGCIPTGQAAEKNEATVVVDLGSVQVITAASVYHQQSANGTSHAAWINIYDSTGARITALIIDNSSSSTAWRQLSWSGTAIGRYISFTSENTIGTTNRIDDLSITYGASAGAVSAYSDDDGASFTAAQAIGVAPGTEQCGADGIKVGLLASGEQPFLVGALTQVKTTGSETSGGAAYSNETNSPASPINPVCIVVPFYQIGSTSTKNTATAAPHYWVGSNAADGSGKTIYKVTSGAAAVTQPSAGYVVYNPSGMAACWWDGRKVAALMSTGGADIKLFTSSDTGVTWSDRGVVGGIGSGSAKAVQFRQGDTTGLQLFFASAVNGIGYSPDFGANISYRAAPSAGSQIVRFIKVWG